MLQEVRGEIQGDSKVFYNHSQLSFVDSSAWKTPLRIRTQSYKFC